jgi:hypothetical protein
VATFTILKKDLPPIDGREGGLFVRYRITTDDRNKFSAWSPIYEVAVEDDYADVNGAVNVAGGIITIAWDLVADFSQYDLWVAWDDGTTPSTWEFYSRISGSFTNIAVPSGPTLISARVYLPTYPVGYTEYAPFLIFESLANAL